MRQASLYYYFTSKEAALEQVCQRGIENIIGDTEAIAAGPGGATERLAAIMRRHIEPLTDNSASLRAFLHEGRFLPKEARRRIGPLARRYERIVEDVLEQGIAAERVASRSQSSTRWMRSSACAMLPRIGRARSRAAP